MVIKNDTNFDFLRGGGNIKLFFENNKSDIVKISQFIKYISLSCLYIKNYSYDNEMKVNMIEAILYDLYTNKNYYNATFGFSLILLLPTMKHAHFINNEGIKLWIILYCIWNYKVFNNKDCHLSHLIPPLYTSLLSFGFNSNEILNNFCQVKWAFSMRKGVNLQGCKKLKSG